MHLVKNPNEWSCMLASFSMLLNESMETLVEEIGHDGSEIWWPDHVGCNKYRSFHIQEFLDVCFKRGKIIFTVDAVMNLGSSHQIPTKSIPGDNEKRIKSYLRNFKGVIYGMTPRSRTFHMCAWDKKKVYDPRGEIVGIDEIDLYIFTLYALHNL